MLNKAQVIGNLGADPKVTIINNGQTKVASFSVATTERGYTTQSGVQSKKKQNGTISCASENWLM